MTQEQFEFESQRTNLSLARWREHTDKVIDWIIENGNKAAIISALVDNALVTCDTYEEYRRSYLALVKEVTSRDKRD
jgi:hypothetical protein